MFASRQIFKLLSALALLSAASAYSAGAPEPACEDMTPQHHVSPQDTPMPFTVKADKNSIRSAEQVKVVIEGNKPFKGFLIQARSGGTKIVGSFKVAADDKYVRAAKCQNQADSAATHKNSNDKGRVELTWVAPANFKGEVQFFATVAENGGVFWVKQPTQIVKIN